MHVGDGGVGDEQEALDRRSTVAQVGLDSSGGPCRRRVAASLVLPAFDAVEHGVESLAAQRSRTSAQVPIRDRLTYPPARVTSVWDSAQCTSDPMVVRCCRGHGASMTVLVAYDPQTLDSAPVNFAAAAARFADLPLVIASIRADVAPAPSARVDLLGEELGRLRADLAREHGTDVRTRVVRALPPAGVARALQHVIVEEH